MSQFGADFCIVFMILCLETDVDASLFPIKMKLSLRN